MTAERARAVDLREDVPRKPQLPHRLPVPIPRRGVIQHGGGDVGIFGLLFAREEIAQKIRHEKKRLGVFQIPVVLTLPAIELVHGVEAQIRDSGAGKERRKAHDPLHSFPVFVLRVAVCPRQAEKTAVFVQQAVIHAPGVDTKAAKFSDARLFEGGEALFDLPQQVRQIPVPDAIPLHIVVFKPVQLPQGDPHAVKLPEDRPAVGRAQIEGKVVFHTLILSFRPVIFGISHSPSWR